MEIDGYDENIFGKCVMINEYRKIVRNYEDRILVFQLRLPNRLKSRQFTVVASLSNISDLVNFYKSNLLNDSVREYRLGLCEKIRNFIFHKDAPAKGSFYFKEGPLREYGTMDKYAHLMLMNGEIGNVIDYTHLMFPDTGIRMCIIKKERYEQIRLKLED